MRKPLFLFAIIFAVAAWFLGAQGMDEVNLNSAIAKAPTYVAATPVGITETKRKRSTSYEVNYVYQVAGVEYKINSKSMDKDEATALLDKPNVEVAFATGAPEKALMRHDFDQSSKQGMFSALLTAAGMALLAGLIGSLVLSWKFGWLSRSAA